LNKRKLREHKRENMERREKAKEEEREGECKIRK